MRFHSSYKVKYAAVKTTHCASPARCTQTVLYPSLGGELREIRQRPWTGLFLLLQLRFFNHSVTMVTSASTLFLKYFKILFLIPSILEDLIFGVNG